MSGFGVFLAIATAFSWALGCVVHTTASRVVGIPAVMLIRQPLASVVLGIFCLVMGDLWLPSLHLFWLAAWPRSVRDHHRRRLPVRGRTDHRPASGAGVPIAVLMLHRPDSAPSI